MQLKECAVLFIAAMSFPVAAWPQAPYPSQSVRIVVTAAPGAGGDFLTRMLAQHLSDKWKQSVVVDNKTGGGGQISANEAAKSPADGHTLFVSNDAPAIAPNTIKSLSLDYRKAFEPISLLVLVDFKLLVRPDLPANNVAELIAWAKASPKPPFFASAGTFTSHHLIGELFRQAAAVEAVHVPFKGAVPELMSLVAGSSDYGFAGFSGTGAFIQSGQLREIASTAAQRNPATPHLPTVGETIPGFAAFSWFAMWTRAEVPTAVRALIWRDVSAFMKLPAIVQRVGANGMTAVGSTPEELRAHLNTEQKKWAGLPAAVLNSN